MAPLKVTAAVCVVLVLLIQLQAPAAAQDIRCDDCGSGCGSACRELRQYRCNGFCNVLPSLCEYCYTISANACVTECFNLCKLHCK